MSAPSTSKDRVVNVNLAPVRRPPPVETTTTTEKKNRLFEKNQNNSKTEEEEKESLTIDPVRMSTREPTTKLEGKGVNAFPTSSRSSTCLILLPQELRQFDCPQTQ